MERGGDSIGLEVSNTFLTHTHAVRALRPVIVPAGVARCALLFWAFILSSVESATPSLSQVPSAPSLPFITSKLEAP